MTEKLKNLVGRKVESVWMSDDNTYLAFVFEDGSRRVYEAEGDCCAHAYFYQVEGANDLIGHEIVAVYIATVEPSEEDMKDEDALDCEFIRIVTAKHGDTMTIDFRVSHNGYYGGWAAECQWPESAAMKCIAPKSPAVADAMLSSSGA